jgi:peptidylprolyl isomerase
MSQPLSRPDVEPPTGPAPDDLVIEDLVTGEGQEAKAGDLVSAHYVGVTHDGGEQFDASWDRGDPLEFRLGVGMVIQGWDEGIEGMRVGGRRRRHRAGRHARLRGGPRRRPLTGSGGDQVT